ncbi:hypothetical protein LCGC14_1978430 [marine sediment metagenome]|uniref:Uncharacterized protein n=1 Tax=marine sediment metagenome TaxID=412755 RepID=A0A0F9FXV1_9ZZZZ|nr:hypothetical protein [Candidatus Scalindua sp.]
MTFLVTLKKYNPLNIFKAIKLITIRNIVKTLLALIQLALAGWIMLNCFMIFFANEPLAIIKYSWLIIVICAIYWYLDKLKETPNEAE